MTNLEKSATADDRVGAEDLEEHASEEVVDLGQHENETEKTLAFLVDPEASSLQMQETAAQLLSAYGIERVIVDLTSDAGIAVAQAAEAAGVVFESLDYGQEKRFGADLSEEHERLSVECDGVAHAELGAVSTIDANLVLVPTTQGEDESSISLGLDSLPGIALQQLQESGAPCVIVLPPEAGLATEGSPSDPSRIYVRKMLHVRG